MIIVMNLIIFYILYLLTVILNLWLQAHKIRASFFFYKLT